MKIQIYFILLLFLATASVFGQQNFLIKTASKNFDVQIKITKCENETCEGKAAVSISKKNSSKPFQTIRMPNLFLELGTDQKPTANLIELYGENNSGVVFDDFNFDGLDDLALRNGNDGAYGGPSYDILLFSKASNSFVKSPALTTLASENLGLFTVNKKTKTLETFNKSGCCWHQTVRYQIVNNRPKKVYVFTEDALSGADDKIVLTTEILVNGRWKKTRKTALTKDYYKEN
ncbi:MAG: hypothetical protein LUM44_17465 [Pyrinomonadaceae bacterium]|nr:hypothetical protein [Pyrinomonadaceae bacterium]